MVSNFRAKGKQKKKNVRFDHRRRENIIIILI